MSKALLGAISVMGLAALACSHLDDEVDAHDLAPSIVQAAESHARDYLGPIFSDSGYVLIDARSFASEIGSPPSEASQESIEDTFAELNESQQYRFCPGNAACELRDGSVRVSLRALRLQGSRGTAEVTYSWSTSYGVSEPPRDGFADLRIHLIRTDNVWEVTATQLVGTT